MTWEYLQNPEFQARFRLVSGILEKKVMGAVVVDLNCGGGVPLPRCFMWDLDFYYGNDLFANSWETEQVLIEQKPDSEIWSSIFGIYKKFGRIDILLHLGDGAGFIVKNKEESATAFNTFRKIVREYNPKDVVHEVVKRYEESYGIATLVRNFMEKQGYNLTYDIEMNIKPDIGFVSSRVFSFFERRD